MKILKYCSTPAASPLASACRRSMMCRHFNENAPPCQAMCDHCRFQDNNKGKLASKNASDTARAVVELLEAWPASEKRATMNQLIEKMMKTEIGKKNLTSKKEYEGILEKMLELNIVSIDFGFTAYSTNVYLKCARSHAVKLLKEKKLDVVIESDGGFAAMTEAVCPSNCTIKMHDSDDNGDDDRGRAMDERITRHRPVKKIRSNSNNDEHKEDTAVACDDDAIDLIDDE